ncbi:MAG: superoxide dismutase [Bacteroidota bacterium]
MDKRTFLKTSAMAGLGGLTLAGSAKGSNLFNKSPLDEVAKTVAADGTYKLPPLAYAYDALEPHIDQQTMRLHHSKHHAGYVKGFNNAVAKIKAATKDNDFGLIKHWERELAFHGAGHFLHTLFWNSMNPNPGQRSDQMNKYLQKSFGGYEAFSNLYQAATKSVEGSGWGILAYEPGADKLTVLQAEKHQNQTQWVAIPILVCDVWEHAYYLKYQNMRGDYINNFMQVIDWKKVSDRLAELVKQFQ